MGLAPPASAVKLEKQRCRADSRIAPWRVAAGCADAAAASGVARAVAPDGLWFLMMLALGALACGACAAWRTCPACPVKRC